MPTTIHLRVRAAPRARSAALRQRPDESLAARITASSADGRADRALTERMAEALDMRRRDIGIKRSTHARDTHIAVTTDNPSAVLAAVNRLEATS